MQMITAEHISLVLGEQRNHHIEPHVMCILRLRRGIDEDDTSEDEQIRKMAPHEIVRERTAWELGTPGWADTIAFWMEEYGAKPEDFDE
jgi:hypothetical protein